MRRRVILLWFFLVPIGILHAQTKHEIFNSGPDPSKTPSSSQNERPADPIVVSAQRKNGKLIYRVNGKVVETSPENSLMTNLNVVLGRRGKETSVFIVIDVLAPFAEFTHIDTALDKVDLPNRRYFVSNFTKDRMMTEVRWAGEAIPIPRHSGNQ